LATPGRITSSRERDRARPRRRRRTRRVLRWVVWLLVVGVAFFAGLAVGRAVQKNEAKGDQTLVRTLVPTTLIAPETVTVTVSKP
jgi:ABC-type phosphate/phosphonate transport system permease subunit